MLFCPFAEAIIRYICKLMLVSKVAVIEITDSVLSQYVLNASKTMKAHR